MKCKYCYAEMRLDNVYRINRWDRNKHYVCNHCGARAIEKIRSLQVVDCDFEKKEDAE